MGPFQRAAFFASPYHPRIAAPWTLPITKKKKIAHQPYRKSVKQINCTQTATILKWWGQNLCFSGPPRDSRNPAVERSSIIPKLPPPQNFSATERPETWMHSSIRHRPSFFYLFTVNSRPITPHSGHHGQPRRNSSISLPIPLVN